MKKRFKNTFKCFNNDINEFILLLRKGVYPYEYMDECEKFNEKPLPEKEEIYSNLNMEGITDMQAKRVCKDFEIKMLILIIMIFILKVIFSKTDVFKNFRKICLKIFI